MMIDYIYLITNSINSKQYIGQHRTYDINDDYNMTEGGEGGLGRKAWNKGKHHSEEARQKISASLKGRHLVWNEAHTKKILEIKTNKIY